ncbi:uncharacterized protein LOC144544294 [Carex rostrata]
MMLHIQSIKREGFRTVEHDARIQLTGATKIQNDEASFPLRYFDFKSLNSIGTTITGDRTIVDVIGQVVLIGPIKKVKKNNALVSIRDVEIEDERKMESHNIFGNKNISRPTTARDSCFSAKQTTTNN